jgi:predicted amidophosphoribosyltransferase
MPEQRYASIGPFVFPVPPKCNVCEKDVSSDPAKFHYGICPLCQRETRHVIPFHGVPWHCREPHANDASACAVCGKPIEENLVFEFLSRGGPVKRLCMACDPLAKAWHRRAWYQEREALLDLLAWKGLKKDDQNFIIRLLMH